MAAKEVSADRILNINVGVLGHVDSGKTSLCKAISTHLSTAALDKHPQSKDRGITLDLGFSSFMAEVPASIQGQGYDKLQFTMVDCPGHASLIRTVIGGAQIIDMMLLVIDVTKGIQTQTAECLVIGEILTDRLVVVLNKTDKLGPPEQREAKMKVIKKKLAGVFAQTKFGAEVTMVATCAAPGGEKSVGKAAEEAKVAAKTKQAAESKDAHTNVGTHNADVAELVKWLQDNVMIPQRNSDGAFYFAVDHCFQIGGQGTVMTGTVLRGKVSIGQTIELPLLGVEKKVKSMQMFHQPVQEAKQGDRLGLCVPQVKQKEMMERGLACEPRTALRFTSAIVCVNKVRFFKGQVATKAKFHVSIGHATVMATATFFASPSNVVAKEDEKQTAQKAAASEFDLTHEYEYRELLVDSSAAQPDNSQFALLQFEQPIVCEAHSIMIGSRLDSDIHQKSCRLAFWGRLVQPIAFETSEDRAKLLVYKTKERVGTVDRVQDEHNIIGSKLFKKETDMTPFLGLNVTLGVNSQVGRIEGTFGTGGKFKVYFQDPLPFTEEEEDEKATEAAAAAPAKGKGKKKGKKTLRSTIVLSFKKFIFATDKKQIVQS